MRRTKWKSAQEAGSWDINVLSPEETSEKASQEGKDGGVELPVFTRGAVQHFTDVTYAAHLRRRLLCNPCQRPQR
jgi:hypothetical protein